MDPETFTNKIGPLIGAMRYNQYEYEVEIYDGSDWTSIKKSQNNLNLMVNEFKDNPQDGIEALKLQKLLIKHQDNPLVQSALNHLLATLKLIEE